MPSCEYTTRSVAQTRRQLLAALAKAPGLLLIEGPSGCGKSHLKQQISTALATRFTLIDLSYSRLDPEQFATTLASCLSPGDPPAADPMPRVQTQIATCARSGKPLLLLIDDAQFMPADTRAALAALASQAQAAGSSVYGVLFADAGANARFALLPGADSDQGLHQRLSLAPPALADMQGFLEAQPGHERLAVETREQLLAQASGSLRRLRQLLDLALLEQASEAREQQDADEAEPSHQDRPRQDGQFAFGLVGGDDFPQPGPATRRAMEQGNELDALVGATEPETQAAPTSEGSNLPVLYQHETSGPGTSRKPALRPAWLVAALGLLITLLMAASLFQEQPLLAELVAREQSESATPQAKTASIAAVPSAPESSSRKPPPAEPSPEPPPPVVAAPLPRDTGKAEAVSAPRPDVPATAQPPAQPSSAAPATAPPPQPMARAETSAHIAAPSPATPPSTAVDLWMERARAHEAAYRLTLPADDNAVRSYREVLTLNPEHAMARAGLQRIQTLYRRRASRALEQGDWEEARHNFRRLLWIDGNDRDAIAQLAQLVRRLEQPQPDTGQ